jgi:hypothetical protein
MRIFFSFLFVLITGSYSKGQTSRDFSEHGTYIIAAISNNGITVGSDSRSVKFDKNHQIASYYDGASKIFKYNNIVIAVAGQHSFTGFTFVGILNAFKKAKFGEIDVLKFFDVFMSFAKTKLDSEDYAALSQNQYLICGYHNNSPRICWRYNTENIVYNSVGDYKTNYVRDDGNENLKVAFSSASKATIIKAIENLIIDIEAERNKKGWATIGGLPSIINLTSKGYDFEKLQNKFEYNTISEFAHAFNNNLIPMVYRSELDKKEVTTFYGYYRH